MTPASRSALEQGLAVHGLQLRGGWIPTQGDALPRLPAGAAAAVVWMVGQVGSACWSAFSGSRFFADGLPDPMDRWSKSIGDALARTHGGIAIYPSDGPPYAPFQQWARRADPRLQTSPLLLQIHPQWGLWHALRFALVLPAVDAAAARELLAQQAPSGCDICLACAGQPCLQACPVQAFGPGSYDVPTCADHLHRPEGAQCMQHGCLARRACPVAAPLRYEPAHVAFHMAAIVHRH